MRKATLVITVLVPLMVLPGVVSAQLTAPSARSFGLAGSFAARARGYEASYWNPANLALPDAPSWSLGIVGANATINNNSLSYGQITDLYGEFLDDETKSEVLANIRQNGADRFQFGGELGASALSASIWRFGFGLSAVGIGDLNVTPDAAELVLFGNVGESGAGGDFDLSGDGDGSVFSNLYVSYAQPFSFSSLDGMHLSVGASAKYGIAHALALVIDSGSAFTTNPLVLEADMLIISSNGRDAGRAWGLDFGAAMDWSNWSFSLGLQNAFTNVSWNVEDFEVSLFEGRADVSGAVLTDTTVAYTDLSREEQQQVQQKILKSKPAKQ